MIRDFISRPEVHDAIAGTLSWAEKINSVRLMVIVLVAAHVGRTNEIEVRVDGEFAERVVVAKQLEHELRNLRYSVPRGYRYVSSVWDALPSILCIGVAAVTAAVHGLRALIGSVEEGVFGSSFK